jgi:hypothetical protein
MLPKWVHFRMLVSRIFLRSQMEEG